MTEIVEKLYKIHEHVKATLGISTQLIDIGAADGERVAEYDYKEDKIYLTMDAIDQGATSPDEGLIAVYFHEIAHVIDPNNQWPDGKDVYHIACEYHTNARITYMVLTHEQSWHDAIKILGFRLPEFKKYIMESESYVSDYGLPDVQGMWDAHILAQYKTACKKECTDSLTEV